MQEQVITFRHEEQCKQQCGHIARMVLDLPGCRGKTVLTGALLHLQSVAHHAMHASYNMMILTMQKWCLRVLTGALQPLKSTAGNACKIPVLIGLHSRGQLLHIVVGAVLVSKPEPQL